ncbi:MAG: hypothetical protein ACTHJJ_13325 [Intrasporangium sp.]|uniref:hypothetical protein n=1 Tax=Intrasporangium sp. TaxID=1925024 RepID=UPI003F7F44B0
MALLIFLASRAVSAIFVLVAEGQQPDLSADPGWHVEGDDLSHPGYWEVLTNWDGQWYKSIALHGYPTDRQAFGPNTPQNETAFYPLYPLAVRALMQLSGLRFEIVAPCLSLAASAFAIVLLFRWLEKTRGLQVALGTVAVLAAFPTSPVFQMAYTEGLAMVFLIAALRAAVERRYPALFVASALLAFTRPIALPLGAFVLLLALRSYRRARDSGRAVDRTPWIAGAAVAGSALLWPLCVWSFTGIPDAYFRTAGAWVAAGGLRGGWIAGLWSLEMPVLAVSMALLLGSLLALRLRRGIWTGPEDRLGVWAALYMIYILFSTSVNTSIFRYALLTFVPLASLVQWACRAKSARSVAARWAPIVLVELLIQFVWVHQVLVVHVSPSVSWPA